MRLVRLQRCLHINARHIQAPGNCLLTTQLWVTSNQNKFQALIQPVACRSLSAGPVCRSRGKKKRSKRANTDQDDALEILEQAARRTTTPQLVDPASIRQPKARRPDPKPKVTGNRKKRVDDQEAADFLDQALQRVTGGRNQTTSRSPDPSVVTSVNNTPRYAQPPQKTRKRGRRSEAPRRKQKETQDEEAAAFLEEATKRVTGGRPPARALSPASSVAEPTTVQSMNGRLKGSDAFDALETSAADVGSSDSYGKAKPPRRSTRQTGMIGSVRRKAGDREASNFMRAALERVSSGLQEDSPHPAAQINRGDADPGEHIWESSTDTHDELPSLGKNTNDTGDDIQSWFKEILARAESHESLMELSGMDTKSASSPKPSARFDRQASVPDRTRSTRAPRPLEPWKLRSRRSFHSTSSLQGPSRGVINTGCRFQSQMDDERHLSIRLPLRRSFHLDSRRDAGSGTSGKTNINELTDSDAHEKISTSRPSSDILSGFEHEQLSSMLSSLSHIGGREDTVASGNEVEWNPMPAVEISSLSPYQLLHPTPPLKEVATKEARQRLQDNPWAQILASPIRRCQATGTRLPKELLVGWNFVTNPRDDLVYLLPEELTDMNKLEAKGQSGEPDGRDMTGVFTTQNIASDPVEDMAFKKPEGAEPQDQAATSDDLAREQREGHGKDNVQDPEPPSSAISKPRPPVPPAKVYIRPSYVLLEELNSTMLAVKDHEITNDTEKGVQTLRTMTGAVQRLIPPHWKDKAQQVMKRANGRRSEPGRLVGAELRDAQWHANVHNRMRDILRMRVVKALQNLALRNRNGSEMNNKIVPLPSPADNSRLDESVTTSLHGVDQAILLWCGDLKQGSAQNEAPLSSSSFFLPSPWKPSPCEDYGLEFIAQQKQANMKSHPADDPSAYFKPTYQLIWKHRARPTQTLDQPNQPEKHSTHILSPKPFTPPTIRVESPNRFPCSTNMGQPTLESTPSSSSSPPSPSSSPSSASPRPSPLPHSHTHTHNIPIFNLSNLLYSSHQQKPPTTNPLIDMLLTSDLKPPQPKHTSSSSSSSSSVTINSNTNDCWVLIKGSDNTPGFKILAKEIWRLWGFVGGHGQPKKS